MKKTHLVSIRFKNVNGENYLYTGLVTGIERNGKLIIDPNKLFLNAFGFNLPDRAEIHY